MNCENAKLYYYDYLKQTSTIDAEVVKHIENCPVCQQEIDRLREVLQQSDTVQKPWRPKWLGLHYQLMDQWISCDKVRPFLPSLLIEDLHISQSTPVTAHIDKCPSCRQAVDKIAGLSLTSSGLVQAACYLGDPQTSDVRLEASSRRILDDIRNRKVSNILTRMRLTEADESQLQSEAYVVDVKHCHAVPVAAKRIYPRRAVSAWIASGIAAAVLFAVLIVLPAGDVQAVDVSQLYMTLDTVQNVHIQKLSGSHELENIWISEGLGAYLFQQPEATTFINKNSGKTYRQHQGAMQLVSRGGEMDWERPWGLLPFKNISQLPADYEWEHVSDTVLENDLKVRIYEWRWTETPNSQLKIKHTWRGYLDARTFLPYKIEYLDTINDLPPEMIMEMKISYPSDLECRDVFGEHGFGGLVYGFQDGAFSKLPPVSNAGCTDGAFVLSTWPSEKTTLSLPEE